MSVFTNQKVLKNMTFNTETHYTKNMIIDIFFEKPIEQVMIHVILL